MVEEPGRDVELGKVSKQAVANWRIRYDHFPRPVQTLQSGPVWERETVEAWVKRNPASPGSRFFSYGEYLHDGGLEIQADGTLRFFLEDATAGMQNLTGVPGFSATSGFMRHSCPGLKE